MALRLALGADQVLRLRVCSHLEFQELAVVMVQSYIL